MKLYQFSLFLLVILVMACTDESPRTFIDPGNPGTAEWLVPENQVLDGGVGRDGIPAIESPNFTEASQINFLSDDDLVMGIRIGDEIKAYPHPILDWHEIVNDEIGDHKFSLTYCPLTGTGIGWNRVINGKETTFGVSGLLYNTNLMPYDRETGSIWSQQRLDCVNGRNIGKKADPYTFVETTWATWKAAFPNSKVLNTDTGINRNYTRYPYGDYRTNNGTILFPISNEDDRLAAKDRVLGVRVDETFKAYPFSDDNDGLLLDSDNIEDTDILVLRNKDRNFMVAFVEGPYGPYEVLSDSDFPLIVKDAEGTRYDILGYAEEGNDKQLRLANQFIGYWFSWGTFYPDIEIF